MACRLASKICVRFFFLPVQRALLMARGISLGLISSQRKRVRQYDRIHAVGERSSRARRRRTSSFHFISLFLFHLPTRSSPSVVRPPNDRSSRRCVERALSSSGRRTWLRRLLPSTARTRSGAARVTRGRRRTPRAARREARARFSRRTVRC